MYGRPRALYCDMAAHLVSQCGPRVLTMGRQAPFREVIPAAPHALDQGRPAEAAVHRMELPFDVGPPLDRDAPLPQLGDLSRSAAQSSPAAFSLARCSRIARLWWRVSRCVL